MRLDKLPIDRDPAKGLWDKREIDPDATQLSRRAGSLRQAEFAEAPGAVSIGGSTLKLMDASVALGVVLFSVRPGTGALSKRLLYMNSGANTFECTLRDVTTIRVKATGSGGSATADLTIAGDTNLAMTLDGTTFGISDGTTTSTVDIASLSIVNSGLSFLVFGDAASPDRDTTAITNVHIFETYATPVLA